jgi:hypothetical protein
VSPIPPTIECNPSDGQWHAGNVELTCGSSDIGGPGLADPVDASFTLSSSVAAGVEDADASTGTHQVCDSDGNCATAGPISGIMVDREEPAISCGAVDSAWHDANVAISCTASDGGSGLADPGDANFTLVTSVPSGTADANASTDAHQVCDAVGNCATAGPAVAIKVDLAPPAISCGTPDATWHDANVAIKCTASDQGSGLASPTDTSFTLSTSVPAGTSNAEASTGSHEVCDVAGNCVVAGPIGGIKVDLAPPEIACGKADGSWHDANVAIKCTSADGGSGLAHASDGSFTLSTSVAAGSASRNASTSSHQVCDVAGNCATAGPIAGNKIDRAPPSIALTTPRNGGRYELSLSIGPITMLPHTKASYTCQDGAGGSGIATCKGTVADHASIDTSRLGAKSFTVTATDIAGNHHRDGALHRRARGRPGRPGTTGEQAIATDLRGLGRANVAHL